MTIRHISLLFGLYVYCISVPFKLTGAKGHLDMPFLGALLSPHGVRTDHRSVDMANSAIARPRYYWMEIERQVRADRFPDPLTCCVWHVAMIADDT
jgi:hypothetical protein